MQADDRGIHYYPESARTAIVHVLVCVKQALRHTISERPPPTAEEHDWFKLKLYYLPAMSTTSPVVAVTRMHSGLTPAVSSVSRTSAWVWNS